MYKYSMSAFVGEIQLNALTQVVHVQYFSTNLRYLYTTYEGNTALFISL